MVGNFYRVEWRFYVGELMLFVVAGDLYHHRPPSEAKILSTLHHGPHSLESQNLASRYRILVINILSKSNGLALNVVMEFFFVISLQKTIFCFNFPPNLLRWLKLKVISYL